MPSKIDEIKTILHDNIHDIDFSVFDSSYGTQEEIIVCWCEGPMIPDVNKYYRDKFDNVYCNRLLSYNNAADFKEELENKYDVKGDIVLKDFRAMNVGYLIGLKRDSFIYKTNTGREIRAAIWAGIRGTNPYDKKCMKNLHHSI